MNKLFFILSAAALASQAWAFTPLGEVFQQDASASSRSSVLASSASRTATMPNYTTQASVVDGANVTQYMNTNGYVFAVTWSGVVPPALNKVLGRFANINTANIKGAGAFSSYEGDDVVIERRYTAREKSGVAYLKAELPHGFDVRVLFGD